MRYVVTFAEATDRDAFLKWTEPEPVEVGALQVAFEFPYWMERELAAIVDKTYCGSLWAETPGKAAWRQVAV